MRRIILLVLCCIIFLPACGRRIEPEERESIGTGIAGTETAETKTTEIETTETETTEAVSVAPVEVYSVDELTTASSPYIYSDARRWGFSEELTQELYAMRQREAEVYRRNKAVYADKLVLLEPQVYMAVKENETYRAMVYTYNDLKVEYEMYGYGSPADNEMQIVRGEEVLVLTGEVPYIETDYGRKGNSPNPLVFLKDMTGDGNCELVIYWDGYRYRNGIRIIDLVNFREIAIEGIRGPEAAQEKEALEAELTEVLKENGVEPTDSIFLSEASQITAYMDYSCEHLYIEVWVYFTNSEEGTAGCRASIEYEYDTESGSFKPGSSRRIIRCAQNYYIYGGDYAFSDLIDKKIEPFLEKDQKPWYVMGFFHPDSKEYAVILLHGTEIAGGFIVVDEVEQTVLTLSVKQCEKIRDSVEYRFMEAYTLIN